MMFDSLNPALWNRKPIPVESSSVPNITPVSFQVKRNLGGCGVPCGFLYRGWWSGMMYTSRSVNSIRRSARLFFPNGKACLWLIRPMTILVTPLTRAYSAICTAGSVPYTVAICAPSCSARCRLLRRRLRFSPDSSFVSGVCTNRAVKPLWKASAIRAAVRITLVLDGAEERQIKICSPARALIPFPSCTAAWFSWSAVRRMAISRKALRLSAVKKLERACFAWRSR